MDKIEELLRKNMLKGKRLLERGANCPNEGILAGYLNNSLKSEEKNKVEAHISDCLYCLEQLSLAQQAQKEFLKGNLPPSEDRVIAKAKRVASLAPNKQKKKGTIWFLATVTAFALSFLVPKYFLQFLAAAVILGMKWIFESDTVKQLIMVLDKRHKEKSEENAPDKVKERLSK
jgi:hypothetical protein